MLSGWISTNSRGTGEVAPKLGDALCFFSHIAQQRTEASYRLNL